MYWWQHPPTSAVYLNMGHRRRIPLQLWFTLIMTFLILALGASVVLPAVQNGSEIPTRLGGAYISDFNRTLIEEMDLQPPYYGVVVTDVVPDSPAGLAGMRPGDVIVMANSAPAQSVSQLKDAIWRMAVDPVIFQVSRKGTVFVFTVSLR
jgi:S1-C subfamily serine protease